MIGVRLNSFLPAITGFLGALVGAAASVATIWVQARIKDRRDRIKQAAELGMAEFNAQLEIARGRPGPVPVPPPWAYVWFHWDVLKAMEAGDLSEAKIKEIKDRCNATFKTVLNPTDPAKF
jgi:hypothetical protein